MILRDEARKGTKQREARRRKQPKIEQSSSKHVGIQYFFLHLDYIKLFLPGTLSYMKLAYSFAAESRDVHQLPHPP